jgi:hypothetical protein
LLSVNTSISGRLPSEIVGQYALSRTRLPTIIINHKCHNKLWCNDKRPETATRAIITTHER